MSKTALVLQHSPEVRGGLFEEILLEQGWELEVLPLFLGSGLPSSSKEFGMVLALGGPMSANDEGVHPFLKKEIPFIRQVLKVGPPLLGIGLGAQLMAKALGAAVCPGPFKEIGWYWINQTPLARSDPLFSSLDPYLLVFEWHGETFDLPSEADGLAGNRAYPNQAFRLDESLSYGLQFHLEVTEPMIKTWLSSRVQEIKSADPQSLTPEDILLDARIYLDRLHAQARLFFLGYLRLLEKIYGKNNKIIFSNN